MKRILEDLFAEDIIDKARGMVASGKVKKPEWDDDDRLLLKVRDDRNYSTMIDVDGNGYLYGLKCSCDKGAVRIPCVHMAATWLYFEAFTGENIRYEDEYCTDLDKNEVPDFELNTAPNDTSVDKYLSAMFGPKGIDEERTDQAGGSGSFLPSLPEEFKELEQLQDSTRHDRTLDMDPEFFSKTDGYRFFKYEEFDKDIKYDRDLLKTAEKLLKGQVDSFEVETGYSDQKTGAQEMIGNAVIKGTTDKGIYRNWEAKLAFSSNKLLSASCRTWGCSSHYYGDYNSRTKMCEHTLAALLCLKGYLKHNPVGDSTNAPAGRLFNYITNNRNEDDTEGRVRDIKLVPVINLYEGSYNDIYLTFRTGTDKLYLIKDLTELISNVEQGNEYTFGKNTTIRLEKSRLDDNALCWYEFLSRQNAGLQRAGRLADSLRTSGRSYHSGYREYRYTLGKEMRLRDEVLDEFFETGIGKTVEVKAESWDGKSTKDFKLTERRLPIKLEICKDTDSTTKEFRGILLQGDTPETFSGADHTYYIEDGELVRVNSSDNGLVRSLLNEENGGYIRMQIGCSHLREFYTKILPVLKTIADITVHDEDEIKSYIPPEAEYAFFLDVLDGMIVCRADVYYGSKAFLLTDVILYDHESYIPYDQIRNADDELEVIENLYNYLPEYDPGKGIVFCEKDDEIVFRLLDHGLDDLMERGEVFTTDRFKRLIVRKDVKFSMGVSVESSIMNLDVTSEELSREELMEIFNGYRRKQTFVKLKSGEYIKLDPDNNLAMLNEMLTALDINLKDFVKGKMHIPTYRALYLDKTLEQMQGVYALRDKHFKSLIKEFTSIDNSDFELPDELKPVMRNYQQLGYKWLRTLDHYGFGGILADDMGLGKTLQVISVIKAVRDESDPQVKKPSLVVCPASLVYNWGEEIRRFAPELNYVLILGTQDERKDLIDNLKEADIVVTSYDLLKRDIDRYEDKRFRFQIIDEAQYIKNHNTGAAKTVKLIQADTKYALTGTPIENRLSELWSIFDYLMPGLLYKYSEFRERFETPIVKYDDKDELEILARMVHPFILRRVKSDVLKDLPEKLDEIRYAGMDKAQSKLYDAQVIRMRKNVNRKDEAAFNRSKIEILAELTRIRQICCDPSLCFEDYKGGSAKLEACMDLIDSLIEGGHKTLLFSQFTSMLEIIEEKLNNAGIGYYKITGSTAKELRMEMVKKFNADDTPIFLISLKAGGTGLNLTGADSVIHYDPWWNVAAQNQATDRAHRIGQTKIVTVYRLIVKGTIEEKILLLQEQKKKLADDILSGENVSNISLTKEDLMMLLE